VGETKAEMLPALEVAIAELPEDRPRYLMGVGDPATLVEAVALGVDQFDCVMQTRLGRHGTALTSEGKVHVKAARHASEREPLDSTCACEVCARHSRGYLRHLFAVGEPSAARLLSLHNVAWTLQFLDRVRAAIRDGSLTSMRRDVLTVWA
jgi:queuine tRNA-ribosyltransferase